MKRVLPTFPREEHGGSLEYSRRSCSAKARRYIHIYRYKRQNVRTQIAVSKAVPTPIFRSSPCHPKEGWRFIRGSAVQQRVLDSALWRFHSSHFYSVERPARRSFSSEYFYLLFFCFISAPRSGHPINMSSGGFYCSLQCPTFPFL